MKLKLRQDTWREIGETEGKVFQHLALEGPKTFAELVSGVKVRRPLVLMALGWLVREDGRVHLKEQ